ILSIFIAGPFIYKSLVYSGTPLFPLGVGTFKKISIPQSTERWAELKLKAANLLASRDQYGSGRNLFEFGRHLWLIAVPEEGVNNRYDYPLGLMYLLFLGPFLFYLFSSLRKKVLPLISLWVVISWVVWWMGVQQTRFLFVPLILMYLTVVLSIKMPSRVLLMIMLASILLVVSSVYRAHKSDFGLWGEAVLRKKDLALIRIEKDNRLVSLPFYDVAYAPFIVDVVDSSDPIFVLRTAINENK
ncbi:MAG: hypothetical protein NT066_07205, partial [Candidatus Omnitrophica bacterium]|nr:hypothetical protein [Candidatus Omnitrophota bacterium]